MKRGFFLIADDADERRYEVEYVLRSYFNMSTADMAGMEYTEVLYLLDRWRKEQEEVQRSLQQKR